MANLGRIKKTYDLKQVEAAAAIRLHAGRNRRAGRMLGAPVPTARGYARSVSLGRGAYARQPAPPAMDEGEGRECDHDDLCSGNKSSDRKIASKRRIVNEIVEIERILPRLLN